MINILDRVAGANTTNFYLVAERLGDDRCPMTILIDNDDT